MIQVNYCFYWNENFFFKYKITFTRIFGRQIYSTPAIVGKKLKIKNYCKSNECYISCQTICYFVAIYICQSSFYAGFVFVHINICWWIFQFLIWKKNCDFIIVWAGFKIFSYIIEQTVRRNLRISYVFCMTNIDVLSLILEFDFQIMM